MSRTNIRAILSLIRRVFVPENCKRAFSTALMLLVITIFLVSPPIGMRYFRSDILVFILTVIISYYVLSGLIALPRWTSARAFPQQTVTEDFVETLAPWIRLTLQRLGKHGWAKRRAQLKLTRKRTKVLAEMGLAKENEHGLLVITPLGRTVVKVLRPPQAEIAGKEDSALRTQSGRVLESRPSVLRRIA